MKTAFGALCLAITLTVLGGCASLPPDRVREGLAPSGALRVGLNMGNVLLARRDPGGGEPRGVAPDIARELARRAGVPVKFVPYGSSGELNGSIDSGQWDIAFFAFEADRANQVDFSPGYVDIEVTYMVRKESALQAATEVNREGIVVASISSAGYMPVLIKSLTRAKLVRTGKVFDDIIDRLRDKSADAIVGLRPVLVQHSEKNPEFRVVDGHFMAVEQAIGLQKGRGPAKKYVRDFLQSIKNSGALSKIIAENNVRGLTISR